MTRSFAVALVFLEVRVVGGVTGWDNLGIPAIETIVWSCLAFSILAADIALQWQDFRASRPAASKVRAAAQ
jgi:hydrogenase/urease accessory protein HupE